MNIPNSCNMHIQGRIQPFVASSEKERTSRSEVQTGVTVPDVLANVSYPSQMYCKFKWLSELDPQRFKRLMARIADKIAQASEFASDKDESRVLVYLAEGFRKAGESGDLTPIHPPSNSRMTEAEARRSRTSSPNGEMDRICAALQLVTNAFREEGRSQKTHSFRNGKATEVEGDMQ